MSGQGFKGALSKRYKSLGSKQTDLTISICPDKGCRPWISLEEIRLELSDLSLFLESEHPVGTELEVPFKTIEEKSSDCGHHCLHHRWADTRVRCLSVSEFVSEVHKNLVYVSEPTSEIEIFYLSESVSESMSELMSELMSVSEPLSESMSNW